MSLLTKKKPVVIDPIERVERESESAISIFKETVDKLTNANVSVDVEMEKEEAAKAAAETRIKQLGTIKSKNENFIGKINNLFE